MFRRSLLGGSALAFGMLMCAAGFAQDFQLNQLYGQGVHAFHAGNYSAAQRLLDDVINAGSKDPRAYYFRAFAKQRSGGGLDQSDIQTGARYELDGYNGYDIGLSLQRVQGRGRLEFERMRRDATLAIQRTKRSQQQFQPNYGSEINGNEVLRPDVSPERGELPSVPSAPADATDPFDGDEAAGEDVPPNPFGDDPEPAAPADDDNLFGDDSTEEMTPPAEAGDDNLFGDDAPADLPPGDGGDDASGGLFDDAPGDAPAEPAGGGDDGLFGPETGDEPAGGDDSLDDLFG